MADHFALLREIDASLSDGLIEFVDGCEIFADERLIDERQQMLRRLQLWAVAGLKDKPYLYTHTPEESGIWVYQRFLSVRFFRKPVSTFRAHGVYYAFGNSKIFWSMPTGVVELKHDTLLLAGAHAPGEIRKDCCEYLLIDRVGDLPQSAARGWFDKARHIEPFETMTPERDRTFVPR